MRTTKSTKVIFLAVAILSVASAFNNKASITKMATVSVLDAHTERPSPRSFSTGIYGSRARALSSPSSFSQTRHKHTSIQTRLQFSDNASPDTTIESSWWRKIFASTLPSPKAISSSSPDSQMEEQDNVDAYLEFLDRRYRRLHSNDENEQKAQSKQSASLVSMKGKPFSAMDWLTSGGNNNANIETTTSQQQQQDALYVLGVAGLASQKLLQKHHLQTTTVSSGASPPTLDKVVELKEQIDDAIEVNETTDSLKTKINHAVLNNALLPVLRVIYLAQRQKQLFLNMAQRGLMQLASKVTDGMLNTLSQGPRSILYAALTICGGRENILRTVAVGYATLIVFRPVLRAMFADGLAFDPLIQ